MDLNRRGFLLGLAAGITAPYIVRNSGILMPVKQVILPSRSTILEVSQDGVDWRALAWHNIKDGKSPDYRGDKPSLIAYARANFPHVRASFQTSWTPTVTEKAYGGFSTVEWHKAPEHAPYWTGRRA